MIDDPLWTLEELTNAVAAALAEGYGGPPNGRVRDVPDRRTIRYYTTLGLIDRAVEMRGRTALYGRRHLLQLVAIKKLQARRSLAEVQQALAGQTDAALAKVAGLETGGPPRRALDVPARRATRDFWRQEPAAAPTSNLDCDAAPSRTPIGPAPGATTELYQGVPLVDGVTLLLATSRPIDEHDLEAIRAAAAPLIRGLIRRQLIRVPTEGETR
jgi:DNA-binding transcriptional MerR regulator